MIDTLSELKRTSVPTVRAVPTGRQYRASNGKMKDETRMVEFVRLSNGDEITMERWYERMDKAVEAEGKTPILMQIEAEVKEKCAWLKTENQIHRYALECLSTEAYKAWAKGRNEAPLEERHHE